MATKPGPELAVTHRLSMAGGHVRGMLWKSSCVTLGLAQVRTHQPSFCILIPVLELRSSLPSLWKDVMASIFGNLPTLCVLFLLYKEHCKDMTLLRENISLHRTGKWFHTWCVFNHAQKLKYILTHRFERWWGLQVTSYLVIHFQVRKWVWRG